MFEGIPFRLWFNNPIWSCACRSSSSSLTWRAGSLKSWGATTRRRSPSETSAKLKFRDSCRSVSRHKHIITKRGIEGAVILFLLPSYFITVSKKIYILIIPNDLFPFRLHIYMLWFKSSLYWVWFGLAVGRSGGVMTPPCGEHPQTHAAALTSCLPSDKDKLLIKRTLMTFMDESSSSRYFPLVSWPRPFVGEGSPSDLTGGKCKFWGQFNSMK